MVPIIRFRINRNVFLTFCLSSVIAASLRMSLVLAVVSVFVFGAQLNFPTSFADFFTVGVVGFNGTAGSFQIFIQPIHAGFGNSGFVQQSMFFFGTVLFFAFVPEVLQFVQSFIG